MSIIDRLRSLLTPHKGRWKPMLMGLALFAAGIAAAVALKPPAFMEGILLVLALAAWIVGACGMVGYVRWFFASELLRAMQDRVDAVEKEKK